MDDNSEKNISLSADFGLKASLEVKTEIPKEVTGNLITTLTDIIRPFTEARGLRADQIRLQREDVLLEIATKARARAELEKITLHPIPTKMLVPFLEKASLEDVDNEMQDRWAALLLSASNNYHSRHLTFIDILSRLSAEELKFLENFCLATKEFPVTSYPGGHFQKNKALLESNAKMLALRDRLENMANSVEGNEAYQKFVMASELTYGGITDAGVAFITTTGYHAGIIWCYSVTRSISPLDILERERLVNIERLQCPDIMSEIGYFNLTYLGIRFVCDCSPEASKLVLQRPHL